MALSATTGTIFVYWLLSGMILSHWFYFHYWVEYRVRLVEVGSFVSAKGDTEGNLARYNVPAMLLYGSTPWKISSSDYAIDEELGSRIVLAFAKVIDVAGLTGVMYRGN